MPLPELCPGFECETCSVVGRKQALNGTYREITFEPSMRFCITMEQLIDECRPGIEAAFEEIIRKRLKAKVNFTIRVMFYKINSLDDTLVDEVDQGYMSVDAMVVHNVDSLIENASADLDTKIEEYTNDGRNWVIAGIEQLILKVVAFK
jgi:hypothetical protein